MSLLKLQMQAPDKPERGDPVHTDGGVLLVEQRLVALKRVVNGYVVETNDGVRRRVIWNSYVGGWVLTA